MCGVAGFINPSGMELGHTTMAMMLDSLKSRGPDGTSWLGISPNGGLTWTKRRNNPDEGTPCSVSLGCSRLAIVDPSENGLQPLANEQRNIWVVLNGEIYNFVELKLELEGLGHRFKSLTDTEVICHSYEEWGVDCFRRFNGQFGLSIYDMTQRKLILARDRLGVKSLFYCLNPRYFLFASEIKALLTVPYLNRKINQARLATIIALPYKMHGNGEETLFEDVKQVLPGEIVELDSALKITRNRYWTLNDFPAIPISSFREAKSRLHELLLDAVKIRLRGDCPATFILSGGIDSSSVAGIAKKVYQKNLETFSLDLPDPRFNENKQIQEIAGYLNIQTNFVEVNPSILQPLLPKLIDIFDENIPTPNGLLHYLLAKSISAKNYKMVLNGVGGDEAFLGYHDHFLFFLRSLETTKNKAFSKEYSAWIEKQNRPASVYEDFCNYFGSANLNNSPDFLSRSGNANYVDCLRREYRENHFKPQELFKRPNCHPKAKQISDISELTLPHALKMDDRFYMSQGIETRHPFLDYRLVELGLSIPPTMKIRNGISKFVLRSAVKNYIPSSRRKDLLKIGLNLPIDKWMRGPLKNWVVDNLVKNENPIFEFADYGEVQKVVDSHLENKANHYLKLWDLINVNLWLKLFFS